MHTRRTWTPLHCALPSVSKSFSSSYAVWANTLESGQTRHGSKEPVLDEIVLVAAPRPWDVSYKIDESNGSSIR